MSHLVVPVKTKYKNITVSGLPGAGSTTLGKLIAERLGFERYSGGDFMRQYAVEQGLFDANSKTHQDSSVFPDDWERQCDYGVREQMSTGKGCVYESWLSGFLAQQVKGAFKILVYCSDDAVRVDRIANRDDISIDEAKEHIFVREEKNLAKWIKMYSQEWHDWVVIPKTLPASEPIYFWRSELYDLMIDTFGHGKEETLEIALAALAQEQ